MSLAPKTIAIIKATTPVVGANANKITTNFYKRLFKKHPELLTIFNSTNFETGGQSMALAGAVVAYASNIDDLAPVMPELSRVIHKHCALGVQPDHYPIVATNLMESVGEVLGGAVTPEVATAWTDAVGFLAGIMIAKEKELYAQMASRAGGWAGKKSFIIERKEMLKGDVCRFTFKPADGSDAAQGYGFVPGQYLTIFVPQKHSKDGKPIAPRHYTIVSDPSSNRLQCAVKAVPNGQVSNLLHSLPEGTTVELTAPCGIDLQPREGKSVLISAGIGATPMVALSKASAPEDLSRIVHVDPSLEHSAFAGDFKEQYPSITELVFSGMKHANMKDILAAAGTICPETHYSICGPGPFMAVTEAALREAGAKIVHVESFGPRPTTPGQPQSSRGKCPI